MKRQILFSLALFFSFSLVAQVTNEGTPLSWKRLNDQETLTAKVLPSFNLEKVKQEDIINDKAPGKPWRFGYMHSVNYGFDDGSWATLENGDRIWRLSVHSEGALSINFIFDDFYIPEGGSLYIYNDDHSDLLGAYTIVENQESGILGTWLVKGEKVIIEYFEPAEVKGQGRLHIAKATHGYRNAKTFRESKGLNDSGNCNLDVDCSIGVDWENLKDHNKKSVGILLSGGSGFCTGALINNTSNDGTPYFLTANHCFSDPSSWAFRFGWISPNPVCAAATPSTNGPTENTISGGTLRARSTNADFCLVEINNPIPSDWNVVYAGWNKTGVTPDFTVGIHHPAGDIMKVCRDNNNPTKEINAGAETWEIIGGAGQGWELGVTEPGSSGSPLFDNEGRIIGQLFGGGAACTGTTDNGQLDYYGRFDVSWDDGSSPETRLKEWLDPSGINPDTIDSNPPFMVLALDGSLSITIPDINCGNNELAPSIKLINNGLNDITSATFTWQLDGGNTETINFNGTLAQNETEVFDLPSISFTEGSHSIVAELTLVNGDADQNLSNNIATREFEIESVIEFATNQVILELLTDDWAEETSWEFRNIDGTVLYSGGPYQQTVEDNTTFTETFDVDLNECYAFEIFDSAGDGICCQYGIGAYELRTDSGEVIFSGAEFGGTETTEVKTSEPLSTADVFFAQAITLHPNPALSTLNIEVESTFVEINYSIINVSGQVLTNDSILSQSNAIDVSSFSSGLYFIKLKNAKSSAETTLKFIKQ